MSAPTLFDPEPPAAGIRPYVIELPARLRLLNSNQRLNRHDQQRMTAQLREAARLAVEECPSLLDLRDAVSPLPVFERAHILGVLHPHTPNRRDPANWYPSFKAATDGLVDAGLFADDDHTRVLGPDMRLGARRERDQIVLVVRALAPGEDPLGYRGVGR